MAEIFNARVIGTFIGVEDHGIFTASIQLELSDGSTQAFGNYDLRHHDAAFHFMSRCIRICGVESWEQLPGATLRARREDGLLRAIGKLLKEDWFVAAEMYHPEGVVVE